MISSVYALLHAFQTTDINVGHGRAQQFHDRLTTVHTDHHQYAAVVMRRRVDQNVVRADIGKGRLVALE